MRTLSVVVMAYDEAANLEPTVHELLGSMARLPAAAHELVIVDDGSRDGTSELADRLAAAHPAVRVVHHPENRGLGGVYRTGFSEARGELLTFFPADGQFPATILEDFYPRLADHDLVLGYIPRRHSSLVARGLSLAEKVLYRALFGSMPRYQGIFMVRRELLASLELRTTGRGWGVVMEMVLRIARGGHRVLSVPTQLRPRLSGRSKVNNPRAVWNNLQQAFTLRQTLRRR
jgi:glycosyltransferase involved in cell wall biosynthesis